MPVPFRTAGLLLIAAVALLPCAAPAQLPKPDEAAEKTLQAEVAELDRAPNTIAAEVGGYAVTWGDVADAIRKLPPTLSGVPYATLYQNVTLRLAQEEAVVLQGVKDGLDKDPVIQRRMRAAANQVFADAELRKAIAPKITDQALHDVYDKLIAGKPGPEEVQARVIMVMTRDEATGLIQQLQAGADFATLARQFSKDGSAETGGDLGYARLDMLDPSLGAVMFALSPGQVTAYPVEVNNRYFIIRFDQVRGALEQDILHVGIPELMRAALTTAPVKYYGVAGKPATKK
jgi:peptidyl-prolyl cis-trans isomerase C